MSDIDFNSSNPPTQEQFNEFHKEPVDYGEDGDQILGKQYTKDQAAKIFTKHWQDMTGEKPDFDVLGSIIEAEAGWTKEPDQYEENDYCFCWVRGSKIKPRYEGWLLWV